MLWLIVILLIGSLSIVLFHKPHVNPMGAGWVPPEQRKPLPQSVRIPRTLAASTASPEAALAADDLSSLDDGGSLEDAITGRVPRLAPEMPDTFNFNDLFGGSKNQGPTDRPNA